jgi:hypothetical protein
LKELAIPSLALACAALCPFSALLVVDTLVDIDLGVILGLLLLSSVSIFTCLVAVVFVLVKFAVSFYSLVCYFHSCHFKLYNHFSCHIVLWIVNASVVAISADV